jgi:hypothetical protein
MPRAFHDHYFHRASLEPAAQRCAVPAQTANRARLWHDLTIRLVQPDRRHHDPLVDIQARTPAHARCTQGKHSLGRPGNGRSHARSLRAATPDITSLPVSDPVRPLPQG